MLKLSILINISACVRFLKRRSAMFQIMGQALQATYHDKNFQETAFSELSKQILPNVCKILEFSIFIMRFLRQSSISASSRRWRPQKLPSNMLWLYNNRYFHALCAQKDISEKICHFYKIFSFKFHIFNHLS